MVIAIDEVGLSLICRLGVGLGVGLRAVKMRRETGSLSGVLKVIDDYQDVSIVLKNDELACTFPSGVQFFKLTM